MHFNVKCNFIYSSIY